jgi:hypothetical protein
MKVDIITQPFLLHIGDVNLFTNKLMLSSFTVLGRGVSILYNVIAISRITAFYKEANEYMVEL